MRRLFALGIVLGSMVAGCSSKKSAPAAVATAPTVTPIAAASVVPSAPSPAPETQTIPEAPPAAPQVVPVVALLALTFSAPLGQFTFDHPQTLNCADPEATVSVPMRLSDAVVTGLALGRSDFVLNVSVRELNANFWEQFPCALPDSIDHAEIGVNDDIRIFLKREAGDGSQLTWLAGMTTRAVDAMTRAPTFGLQNRFLVDLNDLDCRAAASSAMGRILHESGPIAADGTVMTVLWSKDRPVRFRVSREMCGRLSRNLMMAEVIATYSETASADPTRTYTVIAYSEMHPSIIVGTTPATTAAYEAWARQENGHAWRRLRQQRWTVFDLENVPLRGHSASIWHAVEAVGAQ